MAQYDGSIRIKTEIESKKAAAELISLQNRITKTADKIASLRSKMNSLKDAKIPTQEYQEISAQIEKAEQKFNKLLEKQEQMQREGKDNGVGWQRLSDQMDEVGNEIRYAKGELQDLVATGKAFMIGSDTEEFTKLSQQLQYAQGDMDVLLQKEELHNLKLEESKKKYKKLGDTAKKTLEKVNQSQSKATNLLGSFGKRLKSLVSAVFIFNAIQKALNSMISGIKEGFGNLYNENSKFKNSIDELKASLTTLKNSLAAAFAPLVEIAIPYIQKFVEWITKAVNLVGQFIAALTGRKTYTKAIKQSAAATKEAVKETQKEAEATKEAEEAAEGYLSPLDEINKYQKENIENDKTPSAESAVTPEEAEEATTMFEEIPIDSKILDFLQKLKDMLQPVIDYAKKLKDIFMEGFFDGLGDWEYRWESIKDSLASIKNSLIDIFTDPAVVAAADEWAQSVVSMLGKLVGSIASIGLTIATNLLGGIEKYLEQNSQRIKDHLVSMFNIWTEVNDMLGEFFESFAYVFEAFASEDGQQLTANLIGIFTDAFMGASEIVSKLARDILNIIIQPFVDNKEEFRTALEGFLGVLADVTGTIKDGIDETFDKLNEVYDEHFKPFFDSIAQGLSDIIGKFLEFWNDTVQPILEEWAAKFDTLWKEHLQPFLNSVAELLGSIADLLKSLWEKIVQPFIEWIVDNVLPAIMPILESIYNTSVTIIGDIADLLTGFVNTVKGIIDLIVALINGDWSAAWESAKSIVENIFNMIFSFIQTIWDSITGVIDTALQAILSIFEVIFQAIYDAIVSSLDKIKENTTSFLEWINNHIDSALSDVKNVWDNIWNSFLDTVSNIWENIKNVVSNAIARIKSMISNITSLFSGFSRSASSISVGSSLLTTRTVRMKSPAVSALADVEFPGYATGQVIPRTMKKHLAYLGDNDKETEVVSPLSTIKQALREEAVSLGLIGSGKNGNLTLKVYLEDSQLLNSKKIFEAVIKEGKVQQMSTGKNRLLLES